MQNEIENVAKHLLCCKLLLNDAQKEKEKSKFRFRENFDFFDFDFE